jgi:cytochrome c oxidase subunit 3
VPARSGSLRLAAEARQTQVVSSGVLGMLLFVLTEVMLFAGLISAFSIIKASAVLWPPPGQPRLPVEETLFNTAALLLSGFFLFRARLAFKSDRREARRPFLIAMLLGAFFVVFQGVEWARLIADGLTLTSSSLGSFFYLIVGMHALHAVAALGVLIWAWRRLQRGWLASTHFATAEVLWYFVVGLWPVIYGVVYL